MKVAVLDVQKTVNGEYLPLQCRILHKYNCNATVIVPFLESELERSIEEAPVISQS